ncbi:MAG: hypothetical protein A3G18_00860 [Rhodospirillales bacterium RIFCSPLOWO2_12_FULL_58_28]|nr:MAG: hypothetical protein A3H92_11570 [Rhodospirillales bacterium RIFCSPLOWO2_02_FULL_58_16]OHC79811.1 MAG: hypothetical protein A3G18_00860 [Rhodospirillales bacterium RIFCSPLOWO2_12_FULL_58_28]
MINNLKIAKTIELGPTDVAVVWNESGETFACVADADIARNMPPHVYQAFAMMLSRNDSEIMSRMWGKLEQYMDGEAGKAQPDAS